MRLNIFLLSKVPLKGTVGKFFITTPIYYVNASPHLGHLYTSVIADARLRFHKLISSSSPFFQFKLSTGTDEHGLKIQQAASNHKVLPQVYCDNISEKYKQLISDFDIDCTDFIRTTASRHTNAVQSFWQLLDSKGHIHRSKYTGWYCVSDETFLTESQLQEVVTNDGKKIKISLESGHKTEWTEEENYIFLLSKFENDLKYWLTSRDDIVKPTKFQKILLDYINEGLPDISISRPSSRVHWGVTVPGDDSQTIYVWLDALVNYLTTVGFPDETYKTYWPVDLHVIGKDILKFHGIYWPAFLIAAGLEPPRHILCHSHWTVDGEKMSKSKSNVICPFDKSHIYTSDGLRYFLLREGVPQSDGNYSEIKIQRVINAELADTFGNLLSRCTGTALNSRQVYPVFKREVFLEISKSPLAEHLITSVDQLKDVCYNHYIDCNFYKVIDAVMLTLRTANVFFEALKPWELKKLGKTNELEIVLHLTLETLRFCGIILQPIIPQISTKLLDKIRIPIEQRYWKDLETSWSKEQQTSEHVLSDNKLVLFKRIIPEEKVKASV